MKLSPLTILAIAGTAPCQSQVYQPDVTVVETRTRVYGSMMMPPGSPWCDGAPTYWWVGHDNYPERPWCKNPSGGWERSEVASLEVQDETYEFYTGLSRRVDRHHCTYMDVNRDGLVDVICTVGAKKGKGPGYNEVYLTQADGSLERVEDHGLYDTPSMRSRFVKSLMGADGSPLVLITTNGAPRDDGLPNWHRMYRNVPQQANGYFFEEITGPWNEEFDVTCVVVADFDNDGLDDFLLCDKERRAKIYYQKSDGKWKKTILPWNNAKKFKRARVADVTNDGVLDLIVVGFWKKEFRLRVFKGITDSPFFDMYNISYQEVLPYEASDLAVLDVNGDGNMEIYVVQTDTDKTKEDNYCGGQLNRTQYPLSFTEPPDWEAPVDQAQDLLFIWDEAEDSWKKEVMLHAEAGCGYYVETFGSRGLALSQGTPYRHGSNLLLQW